MTIHDWDGITLYGCINISLNDNLLYDNLYGLGVGGEELNHYLHSIDTSNLVDDKPVYYLINQNHLTINASTHPEIGYLALINSTNITIEGLNLTKNRHGILIAYTNNSKIQNNNLTDNYCGICLINSSNNTITQNSLQRNDEGFDFYSSPNNTISENTLEENENIAIELGYSPNCTISKNEIRGSNCGISVSSSSTVISEDGISATGNGISISECFENIIYANNLANSDYGIELSDTSRNIIYRNNITNNQCGIYAYDNVNDNVIRENNIANNTEAGIYLEESENNTIYHNNFLNNTQQISVDNSPNTWDNGYPSGGNYWSDHTGVDENSGSHQNETGNDGINDTSYNINENNTDRYPLMGPINFFDAGTWNEIAYNIDVISNSTVSNFQIDTDQKIISFNVSDLEPTSGFCRIIIPNIIVQNFWQGSYTVLLNGEPCSFRNWTDTTNTYIYMNYTHSDHQIMIVSESPSAIILTLFPVLSIIIIVFAKQKRRNKAPTFNPNFKGT
ncbi:MAG: right-handed parallel beta-helix repeat-containing protein [Candidatus Bathycorpusculaceae bacterium]